MPKSSKEDTKTFSNFNLNGVCAQLLSCFQLFVTLWTVPGQAPLSMGLSQQKYCSGLPFPTPEDIPDPGINPHLPRLLHWRADSLPLSRLENPLT